MTNLRSLGVLDMIPKITFPILLSPIMLCIAPFLIVQEQ